MKLLDVFRKKTKKNDDMVLIKSKFGLPTFKICGVVLADAGPCPSQCLALSIAITKNVPVVDVYDDQVSDIASNVETDESFSDILFKMDDQHIKLAFIDHSGVVAIIFGKGKAEELEVEYIQIQYDVNQTNLESLITIYNNQSNQMDKKLFYRNTEQRKEYESALKAINMQIEMCQIN